MDKLEELLKKRIKLIASYPTSATYLNVGDILIFDVDRKYYRGANNIMMSEDTENFAVNFKPLEWWEDREEKGMPEYVKSNSDGKVYRVDKWEIGLSNSYFKIPVGNGYRTLVASAHLPTTESEYLNQNKIN